MSSIDNQELFEKYYQSEYDYNTKSLTNDDIAAIKKLVREKRVDYSIAPMGTKVFDWILDQNQNINFEMAPFQSEKIDGMLLIPQSGKDKAYVILNSNKPLINQIFTAAHEYYHYINDYKIFKEKPFICDFSDLKSVNEKKASRFAAELLLPEAALYNEVTEYSRLIKVDNIKKMNFNQVATFIIVMTVKYQMPLKAVIYRLFEENYIDSIDNYIKNYDFIKKVLIQIDIFKRRVNELYRTENIYVTSFSDIYKNIEISYNSGLASKEDIIRDSKTLELDKKIIDEMISEEESIDDDFDDEDIIKIIKAKKV